MNTPILYYRPTCGYCRKVLRFITERDLSVTLKNISESPAIRQEYDAVATRAQVPCLVIDGKPLYESDDIIRWLDENGIKNDHP